jgi:hypothetical protein
MCANGGNPKKKHQQQKLGGLKKSTMFALIFKSKKVHLGFGVPYPKHQNPIMT